MVARRGKKSYRAQVRAPVTGQVLSISGASAAEVQARAEHVQLLRRGAKYGDLDPALAQSQALQVAWSTMLLSQLWAAYYKTVQPASRGIAKADWQQRLEPHLGSRRVWDLTLPALQAWVDQLAEEGYANSTIWNSYHRLCGIVQLAVDQRKIPGRPWGAKPPRIRGRPPREREACTSIDEFLELVHQAQSHDHDNWKRGRVSDLAPRVVVAGMCGLRNGELGGLGWDDLLLEGPEPRMVVRHQVKDGWDRRHPEWDRPLDLPKACDPRDPPKVLRIHPGVVQFLHAQRAELERLGWYRSSGPVFPAKGGRWRTKSDTIRPDDLRRLAARAGFDNVERWTTHSLRHTQATLELAFSGGDLRRVQERTRHASIEVMSGYLHMLHRGRPPSAIPELEGLTPMVRGEPVRRELPELPAGPEPAEPPAAAFADLASAALSGLAERRQDTMREIQARRSEARFETLKRLRRRARSHVAIVELAAFWAGEIRAGRQTIDKRPSEINRELDTKYNTAYTRAKRAGADTEECQKRGRASKKAFLANWIRIVKAALAAGPKTPSP